MSYNPKYKNVYVNVEPKKVIKAYEMFGNDMIDIDVKDFTGMDNKYNTKLKLKDPESGEYVPFKLYVKNVQQKKNIREPTDRNYASDISVLLRLYKGDNDDFDSSKPNINVLALKYIAEATMEKLEEMINDGLLWKKGKKESKKDNLVKHPDHIIVEDDNVSNYIQDEDKDGNPIANPIVYVSFNNKNKLTRTPTTKLMGEDGMPLKYKGRGNPDIEIFNPNVNFIQIFKNGRIDNKPKYLNPSTHEEEEYSNVNMQHLLTYNSLLSGQIKFQIVSSTKGIKLTAYFDGNLYVVKNKKTSGGVKVDTHLIDEMKNDANFNDIEESDEEDMETENYEA